MTDRPMLFSGPMVVALLDGRKSQTRPRLKQQKGLMIACDFDGRLVGPSRYVPYAIGDRLWVKEAWAVSAVFDGFRPSELTTLTTRIDYKATDDGKWVNSGKRRSGMFMCKWMSRLTLTVTDVRIQRLQEISEADAIAEGMGVFPPSMSAGKRFRELWDTLNAKRAPWESDPWIIAVTFTVAKGNIDG